MATIDAADAHVAAPSSPSPPPRDHFALIDAGKRAPCVASTPLGREVIVRSLKTIDIGLSTAAYCLAALALILVASTVTGPVDQERLRQRSTGGLVSTIILRMWGFAMLGYLTRNLWELLPVPWEGVCGYNRQLVQEVVTSAVFTATLMVYDVHIQSEIGILRERISGK